MRALVERTSVGFWKFVSLWLGHSTTRTTIRFAKNHHLVRRNLSIKKRFDIGRHCICIGGGGRGKVSHCEGCVCVLLVSESTERVCWCFPFSFFGLGFVVRGYVWVAVRVLRRHHSRTNFWCRIFPFPNPFLPNSATHTMKKISKTHCQDCVEWCLLTA